MAQRIGSALLAAAVAWLLASQRATAQEQITLLDATYIATSANTSDSHYRLPPDDGTPSNWRSPIDYAAGRAHVRLEVLEKPSAAPTLYNVCFEATPTYACLPYSPEYTAPGVYDYEYPFSAFYQGNQVDWAMGTNQIALILKDDNEVKRQGDPNFYPTKIHVTIVLLTADATYEAPSEEPEPPANDAGSIDDPLDASTVLDASDTRPDATAPTMQPDAASPIAMPTAGSAGATPSGGVSGASGGIGGGAGDLEGAPIAGSFSGPRRATKDDDVSCAVVRVHTRSVEPLGWLAFGAATRLVRRARKRAQA